MTRNRRLTLAVAALLAGAGAIVPVLSGTAYAAETLLDTDFENGTASGWAPVGGGNWSVQADGDTHVYKATYVDGGTTTLLAAAGSSTWSNYSYEATVKSGNDANSIGLLGRYQNADNTYKLNLSTKNNTVSISKVVSGTATTLASASVTLDPNVAYRATLTLDGAQLSGAVNGTALVSATDYAFTTGRIAFGGYSKNTFSIDDAVVTSTDGPPAGSGDRYVTPQGAGAKNGSSWADAFPGDQVGGLQAAWNATGQAETLHVGSGTYAVPQTLTMFTGGTGVASLKTLSGVDTGGGLPLFRGDFSLTDQGSRALVDVPVGVSFWQVRDLRIENYYYGVLARGEHRTIRLTNVDVTNMSDGIYLWGLRSGTDGADPGLATHDTIIKGGDYRNYTKSAVRFRNGNYLASVVDTRADGGGEANWVSGNFPLGFRVGDSGQASNVLEHDIVFQDVVSRNNYHNAGDGYWNGDGFTAERRAYNVTFLRSRAFDSTDGGFDDKSTNPAYIDTVALGNKRNYRVWSAELATYVGAVGAYSVDRGGSGDSVGLWAGAGTAVAEVYYSTFSDNANSEIRLEDAVRVDVHDSIIAKTNGTTLYTITGDGPLTVTDSEAYIAGVQGTDPRFVAAGPDWEGGTTAFNSQVYADTKGYHYPSRYQAAYTVQASTAGLDLDERQTASVTAQVRDADGNPVADPEHVIWYSDAGDVARLLVSRGAAAQVEGLAPGTTEIVALYKGAEVRVPVTVAAG